MTVTLAQLLKPIIKDDVLALELATAKSLGFSVTSWQPGSVARTILEIVASLIATHTATAQAIAAGVLNELSTDGWLELFSDSQYDNQRLDAVSTIGTLTLTAAAGAPGPFVIAVSDLVFKDINVGQTYRNTTGGTLVAGGTLDLTIQAETPGDAGNVAANTITIMVTPLVGVTANNPIPAGESDWITTSGADQESVATLRARNRTKWSTLSAFTIDPAYVQFALAASATVTRAVVDKTLPRGNGTLNLNIGGASGAVSAQVVQDVDDYINGVTDGILRRGFFHDLLVQSAVDLTIPIEGTITHDSSLDGASVRTAVEAALTTYMQTITVGGSERATGVDGKVRLGKLWQTAAAVEGVLNIVLTAPVADTTVLITQVAIPDFSTPMTTLAV